MAVQAHYQGYVNALNSTDHATKEGQRGPFMEFLPRDPAAQAKYSAMSSTWQGIESSEAAIARGDYDLDFASKRREDTKAKKPQPKLEMPGEAPPSVWNCSIQ
jgi:hypothetical protein